MVIVFGQERTQDGVSEPGRSVRRRWLSDKPSRKKFFNLAAIKAYRLTYIVETNQDPNPVGISLFGS